MNNGQIETFYIYTEGRRRIREMCSIKYIDKDVSLITKGMRHFEAKNVKLCTKVSLPITINSKYIVRKI